jgi:hypothetical protein
MEEKVNKLCYNCEKETIQIEEYYTLRPRKIRDGVVYLQRVWTY